MTIERARLYDWMLNNLPNLDFYLALGVS